MEHPAVLALVSAETVADDGYRILRARPPVVRKTQNRGELSLRAVDPELPLLVLDGPRWLHALLRLRDERNRPVLVPLELLYAGGALETSAARQCAVMVEHVATSLELDVPAVDREAVVRCIHDLAAVGPGAVDRRCRRVGHVFGNSARGVGEVVGSIALHHPRPLLVGDDWLLLAVRPVHAHGLRAEALLVVEPGNLAPSVLERHHVRVELAVPASLVAPEKIGPSVVVYEDGRVNERRTNGEGLPDRVAVRPIRTVRNSDANRVALRTVAADVPVPLPSALDGLTGPCLVVLLRPLERLEI